MTTTLHIRKTHTRSTREMLTEPERKTRYQSGQPIAIEPETPSRVAIYGGKRAMQRKIMPLQMAVWVIFLLCFGLFCFGFIYPYIAKDTSSDTYEQSSSVYEPVTIEYNPAFPHPYEYDEPE